MPAGPLDDLAVEHRPAVVVEVGGDERAVVVVAGDAVAVEVRRRPASSESRLNASQDLPGRGVVAGVEDRGGAGRVADGARDRVHADVVVPVGDQQHDGLALARAGAARAAGGRSAASR